MGDIMNPFGIIKTELANFLGVPYYLDEQCVIFCVDTLESQHLLPSGIFDLVITSPPYNIGKEYENIMPVDDYVQWTNGWTSETCRLIADQRSERKQRTHSLQS